MKICIPVSPGGHLTQALALAENLKKPDIEIFFVTSNLGKFRTSDLKWKFNHVMNPSRNLLKFVILAFQALIICIKKNPDVMISTGSNVPIPFFILGKLFGKKLIYIESISRVSKPSLSGKILYRFSDLFFVQWKEMQKFYPNAIYAGRLL